MRHHHFRCQQQSGRADQRRGQTTWHGLLSVFTRCCRGQLTIFRHSQVGCRHWSAAVHLKQSPVLATCASQGRNIHHAHLPHGMHMRAQLLLKLPDAVTVCTMMIAIRKGSIEPSPSSWLWALTQMRPCSRRPSVSQAATLLSTKGRMAFMHCAMTSPQTRIGEAEHTRQEGPVSHESEVNHAVISVEQNASAKLRVQVVSVMQHLVEAQPCRLPGCGLTLHHGQQRIR